jgi:hypothetical protein
MRTLDNLHELEERLFELGDVIFTEKALQLILDRNLEAIPYIGLHVLGYWSDLSEQDQQANRDAVKNGGRIISRYTIPPDNTGLWVVTEGNRTLTSVLLPEEYSEFAL